MRSKLKVSEFKQLPILGILRNITSDVLEPLIETIESSGLKTIEITMNTKGAPELIRKAVALSKKRLTIGAGTVLDMKSLRSALDNGATFIVMPVLIKDVLAYCVKNKIPAFPGALTPQEIYTAWQSGATMVKVFPSNFFGPGYFKEIKGPFNDIELLACGGVTPENMKAYFSSGASAISFGASVFKPDWLAKKDFSSIGQSIKKYIHNEEVNANEFI
jgi:2-dehydro-3-deoxyphosphogluconate aldolase/(4S)-4-hydroxy-2-oxoglutarate aldolase